MRLLRAAQPEISVESKGESDNFQTLLAGLESQATTEAESEVTDESGEPVSVRIERVEIEGARAVWTSDQREEPVDLQIEAAKQEG